MSRGEIVERGVLRDIRNREEIGVAMLGCGAPSCIERRARAGGREDACVFSGTGRKRFEHGTEEPPVAHKRPDEHEFTVLPVDDATQPVTARLRRLGPALPADIESLVMASIDLRPERIPFVSEREESVGISDDIEAGLPVSHIVFRSLHGGTLAGFKWAGSPLSSRHRPACFGVRDSGRRFAVCHTLRLETGSVGAVINIPFRAVG